MKKMLLRGGVFLESNITRSAEHKFLHACFSVLLVLQAYWSYRYVYIGLKKQPFLVMKRQISRHDKKMIPESNNK